MSKEAMKQALDALKNTTPTGFNMETDKKFFAAIKALEEALAQPHEMTVKEFNQMILDDPNYHQWLKKRRQNERLSP